MQVYSSSYLASFLLINLPLIGLDPSDIRWSSLVSVQVQQKSNNSGPSNSSFPFPSSSPPPPAAITGCVVNMTIDIEIGCVPMLLPGSGALAASLSSAFSIGSWQNTEVGTTRSRLRKLLGSSADSLASALHLSGCDCAALRDPIQPLPAAGIIVQQSVSLTGSRSICLT